MYLPRLYWMFCPVLCIAGLGCSTDLAHPNSQKSCRPNGPIVHRDFISEAELNLFVFDQNTNKPLPEVYVFEYTGTKSLGKTDSKGMFTKDLSFFGGDIVPLSQMNSSRYEDEMACILILRCTNYNDMTLRLKIPNANEKILKMTVYMASENK